MAEAARAVYTISSGRRRGGAALPVVAGLCVWLLLGETALAGDGVGIPGWGGQQAQPGWGGGCVATRQSPGSASKGARLVVRLRGGEEKRASNEEESSIVSREAALLDNVHLTKHGGADDDESSATREAAVVTDVHLTKPSEAPAAEAEDEAKRGRGRGRNTKEFEAAQQSTKLLELNALLQKAAAYSTFLRERLQQSQSEGAALSNSTEAGAAAKVDRRQPRLITGATMRGYQLDGVQWLISLYENGLNGILGDEMGLGKTLQVIALLAHLWEMRVCGPFLVVAPLSTIGNWVKEFARFAPTVPVVLYHGNKEERAVLRRKHLKGRGKDGKMPIVVTSFEVAMNDARYLQAFTWKYLCVDEGQRLKNKDCKLLRELKSLKAANRLLLSGTPLQNNLAELWSLLNFILPDVFDSLTVFQTWFNFDEELAGGTGGAGRIVVQEEETRIISKLHAILDPFLLRRLKCDVELSLPSKRVYVVYAGLTDTQLKYNRLIADGRLASALPGKEESNGMANPNPSTSLDNTMMQMRKCCNHPYLFEAPVDANGDWLVDERMVQACGKMQLLDRMLKILHDDGHKVLIFFQMTKMMDIVEDYLSMLRGWKCCRIDGGVSFQDRQERLKAFEQTQDHFVFLLSTRAGGLGISLPTADTVIIYDSDFNPQQDLQAMDRCHRIGQTRPVGVYRIITRGSVEVKIYERAVLKRKLELMTINPKRFKVAEKVEGSTDLSTVLMSGKVEVKNTFTEDELRTLLVVNVQPSREGLVKDADLVKILCARTEEEAFKEGGQGFEMVDSFTSSFL